jgi:hypothetical protein
MKKHQRDEETLKLPGVESLALIPKLFSPNTEGQTTAKPLSAPDGSASFE